MGYFLGNVSKINPQTISNLENVHYSQDQYNTILHIVQSVWGCDWCQISKKIQLSVSFIARWL